MVTSTPADPPIHRTTLRTAGSPPPPHPWQDYLTLDLLVSVFSRTLFHPFIAALLPLCLRALAAPYTSLSFIWTSAFAASVCLYHVLAVVNQRFAYGEPRELDWENEVVVITGGHGGLGGCIAEIYAMRGVSVAVLDINCEDEDADQGNGQSVRYYHCDVSNYTQVFEVWSRVTQDLGAPTILINNAAVVNNAPFLDMQIQDVEKTFRINTLSHYHLTSLFLRPLQSRPTGGTLVTIASVLGQLGASNLTAYAASKGALLAYHSSLTAELASTAPQIKTILVSPGQLDTQLFNNVNVKGFWKRFCGPIIRAGGLAIKIVELVDRGVGGEVREPAYARWIAWLFVLPVGVQRVVRNWTGLDEAMEGGGGGAYTQEKKLGDEDSKIDKHE